MGLEYLPEWGDHELHARLWQCIAWEHKWLSKLLRSSLRRRLWICESPTAVLQRRKLGSGVMRQPLSRTLATLASIAAATSTTSGAAAAAAQPLQATNAANAAATVARALPTAAASSVASRTLAASADFPTGASPRPAPSTATPSVSTAAAAAATACASASTAVDAAEVSTVAATASSLPSTPNHVRGHGGPWLQRAHMP